MDLIVLPFHDWKKNETEGARNRDGHLLRHFLASPRVGRVLMVDRPISLPERLIRRRPVRCRSGHVAARRGRAILSEVAPKLHVLDFAAPDLFSPLWLGRDWWDVALRRPDVIDAIGWAAGEAGLSTRRRAIVCWSPLATGPFGKLGERAILFDADDNWTRHPEMRDRRGWIRRGYETACREAGALTCNSEATAAYLTGLGGRPVVIRNGVDPEDWDPRRIGMDPRARDVEGLPKDLAAIPRPWIGYAGRLARRTDVELIVDLSRRRPGWSFVLVGPVLDRAWHRPLRSRPNVFMLGDKAYERLPAYVLNFDVACIFHNVGALENGGDPTKLYEYLAAGKPVVTTPIAGVETFRESIDIESDAEGFERAIEIILGRLRDDPAAYLDNREAVLGPEHDWKAKADRMLDAIDEALEKREEGRGSGD